MRLRRTTLVLSTVAVTAIGLLPALASTPADSGTLVPASSPGVVTSDWSGTIAGANPNSDCSKSASDSLNDHHKFTLSVPSGFYSSYHLKMAVSETASAADSILTVERGATPLGSSDNSSVGG